MERLSSPGSLVTVSAFPDLFNFNTFGLQIEGMNRLRMAGCFLYMSIHDWTTIYEYLVLLDTRILIDLYIKQSKSTSCKDLTGVA